MAGTVAKLPVYNFGQGEHRTVMNGSSAERSSERNMDEDDLFRQLQDDSYAQHREYILDELVARVRRNGGKTPFKNPRTLFRGLAVVLLAPDKDVRLKCIQFIMDLVPILKHELDPCLMLVITELISNFSDGKVSIRKAAVQTLHMYMKHTLNIEPIFNSIVKYGLESEDPKIRAETAVSIPVLLTGEFSNTDLSIITGALAKKFTEDTDLMVTAGVSLERISSLVGEETFNSYMNSLPTKIKSGYYKRTGKPDPSPASAPAGYSTSNSLDWNSNRTTEHKHDKSTPNHANDVGKYRARSRSSPTAQFGIIPQDVLNQLSDQEHWTERASGVQELKAIIEELQDTSQLVPHMINFIGFLCNLLDDSNFKVSLHTLEIFQELVAKFNQNIKPFTRHIVNALAKRFGDNKTVIRQANMKVMMQLMQSVGPKAVVHVVSELKNQRKSGVREEALNIVIAALLTFPSYDFDLPAICRTLSQCLNDQKRRVRQAALELFAVLAQAMGPTRIGPLIDAVDQVELKTLEDGVMKAVQARLARRQLPRLNEDGLVEYASQTPSSAAASGRSPASAGHDTDWILKATRNTSAKERAYTDPGIELSQPSPTRAKLPPANAANAESQPPKRFFSAGRGRSKLPWEEVRDARATEDGEDGAIPDTTGHGGRVQINSAPTQKREEGHRRPPIKARNTWNGGEDIWDAAPTRRSQDFSLEQGSASSGSYRQIHLDKLKRASLNTYPGRGRGNWEDEPHPSGSHSAPVTERGGPDPFIGNTAVIPKKRGSVKHHQSHQDNSDLHHRPMLKQQLSYSEKHMPSVGAPRSRDDEGVREREREQRMQRKSLSNSWPDQGIGMDDGHSSSSNSNRKKMDLMLDSVHDHHHATSQYDIPSPNKSNLPPAGTSPISPISPIPLKATLARSAGRRVQGARAQPLVPLDKASPRDEYDDWEGHPQDTSRSDWSETKGIHNLASLDNIRGSAAKKRAQKMARDQEKSSGTGGGSKGAGHRSPYTPPRDLDESGIFSLQSTGRLDFEEGAEKSGQITYVKRKSTKKETDSPFISKPRMARQNSSKGSRRSGDEQRPDGNSSTNMDFNPAGGVTFRDNATSDVSIVGHGFGNGRGPSHKDIDLSENYVGGGKGQNPRDRKRTKGSILSPLSMASLHHPGGVDLDDSGALVGEDFAMVIGKGVFGNEANIVEYPRANGGEKMSRRRQSDHASDDSHDPLPEVVGLQVKHDDDSPEEDDVSMSMSMSKATMDRITRKQHEKKEEMEQRKAERKAEKERVDAQRRALEVELEAQRKKMAEREQEQQQLDLEKQQREKERMKEERDRQREERMREREELKREREERLREDKERQERMREEKERQKAEQRMEKERQREEREARAREKQREKLKQLELESMVDHDDDVGDLAINGATLDNTARKTSPITRVTSRPPAAATPPKKKGSGVSANRNSAGPPASVKSPPQDNAHSREMKPLQNVDVAIKDCLRYLGQEDWEVKLDGLFIIQRLTSFHGNELGGQLHTITVAVLNEIKNLRSSVARVAISTLGEMFVALKTSMDKDLDQVCRILLPKAGESNAFIREDVDKTLEAMVKNANPQRVLGALVTTGASHKSSMVRKTTSVFLEALVERMGPGRILSGVKDVTDKILPVAAQMAVDNAQETRYYARKMFFTLMHHEDFDRLIEKHVPAKNLKSTRDILENLKNKGLGELPSDTSSAKARRSNPSSRANSGSQSYSRDRIDNSETDSTPPSAVRKGKRAGGGSSGVRGEENETVKGLCEGLGASDWMSRLQAIERLQEMCETHQDVVITSLVKIFDKFASRLSDSNSKVNIAALMTMKDIVPRLGESMAAVVNNVVPILVQNLAAKNTSISQTSNDILDLILEHVDMLVLVQPFSNATQYGNVRARPTMVEKLSYLVTKVYPRKQQTVVRNVLPVLWYLLGNMTGSGAVPGGSGNLRSATGILANSLYAQMGEVLLQHANNLPPRNIKILKELIDEENT